MTATHLRRAGALRRTLPAIVAIAAVVAATLHGTSVALATPAARVLPSAALPTRLSDSAFWQLVSDISEPGGYFRLSDNFTSNEMEIGELMTMLRAAGVQGGVYVGVGPEQNFGYIAAIHPQMAFIIDIRRQAVMQHLMFKVMFELARDRADFIGLLFARPRPPGIDSTTPIARIWALYGAERVDSALARATVARVESTLAMTHRFSLSDSEWAELRLVQHAFQVLGPEITTRGINAGFGSNRDFATLTGSSVDSTGQPQSFLSSEANFRTVKDLEDRNLVVPVSGDFAGPRALRGIGAWVREHGGVVRAFYVSNVEQYLFQDGKGGAFYENVATLPVDGHSVFIRPYSMRRYGRWSYAAPGSPGTDGVRPLCPIAAFLRAAKAGQITSNDQALACAPGGG